MDQVDRDRFDVDSSADRIDVDRIRIRCGSVCKCGQALNEGPQPSVMVSAMPGYEDTRGGAYGHTENEIEQFTRD